MKVIAVCGSLKFKDEIMRITEALTLQGNCLLSIIYPTKANFDDYSEAERAQFAKMHRERIRIADAILVVDVNHYLGKQTQNEIEFAKRLNKEIIYYTDWDNAFVQRP
ncbi:P-loop NTPase family protein [Lapidilactobacillus bayanensis]|uniref:hypothetical protein n=1 Tax=Lapidilactobacillus bayanensis TaxID=2485998 RepID=UPI000F789825|nr:hypothetical protein [Lapidilactobacillus bayanensis]